MPNVPRDDRRSALAKLVIGGLGVLTAGLASLVGVVAVPARRANTRTLRKAGSLGELPPDSPLSAVITERHADGWYGTTSRSCQARDGVSGSVACCCSVSACRS